MTVRSPSKATQPQQHDMEDVELGSSHAAANTNRRNLKAKDSNIVELTPLITVGSGDGNKAASPRGPMSPNASGGAGERSNIMKSVIASTMYSGCSVGMVLVNKSLASRLVFCNFVASWWPCLSPSCSHLSCYNLSSPRCSLHLSPPQLQPSHQRRPQHPPRSLPSHRRRNLCRILQIHGLGRLPQVQLPNRPTLGSRQPPILRYALHRNG